MTRRPHLSSRGLLLAVLLLLAAGELWAAASLAEQREARHARLFLADDRPDLAVAQCRQFLDRFPASSLGDEVLQMEGQAWLAQGRTAEALAAFQGLLVRHGDSPLAPAAQLAVGDCHHRLGRARDAQASWQRIAERYPASPLALTGLLRAEEHLSRSDRPARQDLLRRALELDPDSEAGLEARRRWAVLLLEEGREEAARHLLERVVREAAPGPLHRSALRELAALHARAQRREEALLTLQRPLDDYDDTPWRGGLWLELAMGRLDQGRYPEAERGLRAALAMADPRLDRPTMTDSLRLLLADALAFQARHSEAMETLLAGRRQDAWVQARLGWCLALDGDSSRAALRWAAAAESLMTRSRLDEQESRLLATSLEQLALCQEASGMSALPWERLAEMASQVPPGAPEATPLAAALLRHGLASAAKRLLAGSEDLPRLADHRGLLRLQTALALGQGGRAQDLARIFRDRWPGSPLREEVDRLSPDPSRAGRPQDELDRRREAWARQARPGPEDLRARILELETLRREGRSDREELAGELVLHWNHYRKALAAQGRDSGVQADCARRTIAWTDSLRRPAGVHLLARAAAHEALGDPAAARRQWQGVLDGHGEEAAAAVAVRRLAPQPDSDGTQRARLAERLGRDWAWHPAADSIRLELAAAERRDGRPAVSLAICDSLLAGHEQWPAPLPIMRLGLAGALEESALSLEALGDRAESRRRWLRGVAAAGPDSLVAARLLLRVARSFQADERTEDARGACRALLAVCATCPPARPARRLLAELCVEEGRHGEALVELEPLAPAASPDLGLRAQWVSALYRAGRADQGRVEFQRLLKQAPRAMGDSIKASANLARGLQLLETGDGAQAEKSFSLVVTDLGRMPQAPAAHLGVGLAQKAQGKASRAVKTFTEVEKRWAGQPVAGRAAGERAVLLAEAGDTAGALAAAEAAVERTQGRDRREALGRLADLASRLQRPAAHRRALERYRVDYPDAPDILARRVEEARLLARSGETAAARSALRALQAEASEEEAAEIQFRLGEVAEAEDDPAGAALEYQKVPHLDGPGGLDWGASALFEATRCWRGMGRLGQAEQSLREILRREGEPSGHGRRALAELEDLRQELERHEGAGERDRDRD
ncbi:MAG: tetratricopeptide repeat protein [bacterium]|nr:tetratricopeptide repeat protein [bacterium]